MADINNNISHNPEAFEMRRSIKVHRPAMLYTDSTSHAHTMFWLILTTISDNPEAFEMRRSIKVHRPAMLYTDSTSHAHTMVMADINNNISHNPEAFEMRRSMNRWLSRRPDWVQSR